MPFVSAIRLASVFFFTVFAGSGVLAPWNVWTDQIQPSESSRGVEYSLLMSRNDQVCKHMLALFNRDLTKFGTEKYDEHEEFRSIGWETTTTTFLYGDRELTHSIEFTHVDINNDGTRDLVFRWTGPLRGYDVQTLYIFQNHAPTEKHWTLLEIAHSPGRISHGDYLLIHPSVAKRKRRDKIPPMASISRLDLFVLNGTIYVGMRPPYEFATGTDPSTEELKVYVVTKYGEGKYGGGPDPNEKETGKREDVCYFKIDTVPDIP